MVIKSELYDDMKAALMFAQAIKEATAKADGKNHEVEVIRSVWDEYDVFGRKKKFTHVWLSSVVDDTRVAGGKLGLGKQTVLWKCTVFAPKKGGSK